MKRTWMIIVIILGVILIAGIIYLIFPNEEKYDETKEEQITFISYWAKNLEECQGHSQYLTTQEKFDAGYEDPYL